MKRVIRILLAVVFFLLGVALQGKENDWFIRRYTEDDGLSHNVVRAVLKDAKGYVWFGTTNGLNRYDGHGCSEVAISGGIPDNNYITALQIDSQGKIWLGTAAGMCLYDPASDEEAFRFPPMAEEQFQVYQIEQAPDGHIWVPDNNRGFFRINPLEETAVKISAGNAGSLTYSPLAMCISPEGNIWFINSDWTLYRSSDNLLTATAVPHQATPPSFAGKRIHKMFYVKGAIFVGLGDGLVALDPNTGVVSSYEGISNTYRFLQVSENEIWAACNEGLVVFDQDLRMTARYPLSKLQSVRNTGTPFPNCALLDICPDGGGGAWIGSFNGAVHLLPNRIRLNIEQDLFTSRIVPSPDGSVWIGTENRGLYHYFPSEKRLERLSIPLSSTNIQGLCLDGDNLYIGGWATNKMICLNTKTGVSTIIPVSFNVSSICKIRKDLILVGSPSGLKKLQDGKLTDVSRLNISIRSIYSDRDGNVWISTNHDGLYRISEEMLVKDSLTVYDHYVLNPSDRSSLPSNKVCAVFEDSRGNLWVGAENAGLCLMDVARGTFTRFEDHEYKAAYGFAEDERGLMWITTDKGLLCLNPENEKSKLFYTKDDGLLSNQFNYNSIAIDGTGNLYLGSGTGFISFDTMRFPLSSKGQSILLPSFKPSRQDGDIPARLDYLSSITLKHRDNSFAIDASFISNDILDNSKIMWRCPGLQDKWQEFPGEKLEFFDMPSGHHSVQMILQNAATQEVLAKRKLDITVKVRLLLRWWAILFYLLFFATAVVFTRQVFRRKSERKVRMEKDRMQAEYSKNLYTSKLDFITDLAHEIRTPLTLISAPTESIISKVSKGADQSLKDNLNILSRNTARLNELMLQLMDFRSIEKTGYEFHPELCDAGAIVQRVSDRFRSYADKKDLDFSLQLPESRLEVFTDSNAFDRILSNLLSNAFKYASSHIVLSLKEDRGGINVTCENDGPVVPLDMREKIFKPFVRYKDGKHNISGSGIGLYTSRQFAELLGGTLVMDRDPSGNRFILRLPKEAGSDAGKGKAGYSSPALNVLPADNAAREGNVERRMLIVEDNDDMRNYLDSIMSGKFSTEKVPDGRKALEILSGDGPLPDVVLSDVMMPVMDGFELCKAIKQDINICHIPVILLTAKVDTGSKIEGLEYGADAYVEKPFLPEYLQAVVRGLLDNRERLQAFYSSKPLEEGTSVIHSKLEDKLIGTLESFMEAHLDDQSIRVEDMAIVAGMSKSSLQRKMQALFGMSVNEYISLYRLKAAARIIASEDVPVSEVGYRVGFTSHSYFSKCFRKQFGLSPSEFRGKQA